MRTKMRIGQFNGTQWSGAIGAYLEDKTLEAVNNCGGRVRSVHAAGKNLTDNRIRTLRVLSEYAFENGKTFAHEFTVQDFMRVKLRIVGEAKPRCGNTQIADSTIQSYNESLRAFTAYCMLRRWMPQSLAYQMKKHFPTGKREHKQFLVIPEEDRWEHMISERWKVNPVDAMLLATGYYELLRWSECAGALIGHVDLKEQMGHFPRDKNDGEILHIPLNDNYCAYLERYFHWYRGMCGGDLKQEWHLIPGRVRGKQNKAINPLMYLDDTASNKVVKESVMGIGYTKEDLYFQATHLPRRSGGEALYQAGVDPRDISYYLGHFINGAPNLDMTMRYLGHAFEMGRLKKNINKRVRTVGNELALIEPAMPAGMPVTGVGVSAEMTFNNVMDAVRMKIWTPEQANQAMAFFAGVSPQVNGVAV